MPPPDPGTLLKEGMDRHRAGDLPAAARLYRRVVASRPREANAHNLLGVVARQLGDPQAALRHTERALALQPEAPVFLANHGGALAEAGDLRAAVGFLRAALRRRPDDPVALRNLGQALAALGDARAAVAPLERAAALAPETEPLLALAHARRETGNLAGAATAAEAAAAQATTGSALAEQARFLLAALGRAALPERAPAEYVRDLFDGFAARFDADLAENLDYRTPELLAAALRDAGATPEGQGRGLDLGCGTGLSGLALAPLVRRLEGLDLSPRMLAQARRRGIYAELHLADLLDWLPPRPGAFDLIAAADVLNYLGDLRPALAGIATALRPGGLAAFSLEAGEEGAPFALGPTMRYRHDGGHAAALAAEAGFHVLAQREAALRQERGAPVAGVLTVLRRRG